ncbi:MAG: cysteine peptidase family C39 domain-containing protein [Methanobacterium sp.]
MTSANDQITDTQDLNINPENDTVTTPQKDTSGIVIQTRDYSCGPTALATVLQNIGISVTEQELIVLAGTDTSGTTMHGLSEVTKAKGVNTVGMRLSVDDLKPNNIVYIILDGQCHYSVIRKISNESVYLADPSLGNIEMSNEHSVFGGFQNSSNFDAPKTLFSRASICGRGNTFPGNQKSTIFDSVQHLKPLVFKDSVF